MGISGVLKPEKEGAVDKPQSITFPPLTADALACALTLTGKSTPTLAELTTALEQMYPAGDGPTARDVVASGQLIFSTDGQLLRMPPHRAAELQPLTSPWAAGPATPPRANGLFSFFEGGGISKTIPTTVLTPAGLYDLLVSPRYSAHTKALRASSVGSQDWKKIKRNFDYVTPAGVFNHRGNAGVRSLSGLMVLDFDHLPDIDAARAALLADELLAPGLVMLFTSPSGNGLKAIVWTDPQADHLGNFRGYADYLKAHYAHLGLVPDEAGKDLARACFVPHDPSAWLATEPDSPATA